MTQILIYGAGGFAREVAWLVERCQNSGQSLIPVGFIDDNVNLDKSHVIEICEEIIRRRLDIQFEPTCGLHLSSLDDDIAKALSRAGCVFARLPIEHGNDYIRNKIIVAKASTTLSKHNTFRAKFL